MGKPSVTSDHVSHSKHEFSRKVAVSDGRTKGRQRTLRELNPLIDGGKQHRVFFLPLHAQRGKEVNPDLYRYLFAFVWRYQLPLAQDFVQAMADIS